jgi:hypothetical protein
MKLGDLPQLQTAATDFDKLLKEAKVCVIYTSYDSMHHTINSIGSSRLQLLCKYIIAEILSL